MCVRTVPEVFEYVEKTELECLNVFFLSRNSQRIIRKWFGHREYFINRTVLCVTVVAQ